MNLKIFNIIVLFGGASSFVPQAPEPPPVPFSGGRKALNIGEGHSKSLATHKPPTIPYSGSPSGLAKQPLLPISSEDIDEYVKAFCPPITKSSQGPKRGPLSRSRRNENFITATPDPLTIIVTKFVKMLERPVGNTMAEKAIEAILRVSPKLIELGDVMNQLIPGEDPVQEMVNYITGLVNEGRAKEEFLSELKSQGVPPKDWEFPTNEDGTKLSYDISLESIVPLSIMRELSDGEQYLILAWRQLPTIKKIIKRQSEINVLPNELTALQSNIKDLLQKARKWSLSPEIQLIWRAAHSLLRHGNEKIKGRVGHLSLADVEQFCKIKGVLDQKKTLSMLLIKILEEQHMDLNGFVNEVAGASLDSGKLDYTDLLAEYQELKEKVDIAERRAAKYRGIKNVRPQAMKLFRSYTGMVRESLNTIKLAHADLKELEEIIRKLQETYGSQELFKIELPNGQTAPSIKKYLEYVKRISTCLQESQKNMKLLEEIKSKQEIRAKKQQEEPLPSGTSANRGTQRRGMGDWPRRPQAKTRGFNEQKILDAVNRTLGINN